MGGLNARITLPPTDGTFADDTSKPTPRPANRQQADEFRPDRGGPESESAILRRNLALKSLRNDFCKSAPGFTDRLLLPRLFPSGRIFELAIPLYSCAQILQSDDVFSETKRTGEG